MSDLTSVTEICRAVTNPGEWLVEWAYRQGARGADRHALRESRRQRGIAVHEALEALAAGQPVTPPAPAHATMVSAIADWYVTLPAPIIATEVAIRDEELGVSGRIDYVRVCPDADCGGVIFGDVKTGGRPEDTAGHLQVGGAYPRLWIRDYENSPESSHPWCSSELLLISDDEPPRTVPARLTPDDFDLALAWYRRMTEAARIDERPTVPPF